MPRALPTRPNGAARKGPPPAVHQMSMMLEAEAAIGVWGKKKCGKSFRVKELIARHPRVLAVDINNEYWEQSKSPRGAGPLREMMYASELAADPDKIFDPSLSLAVVPNDDTPLAGARCFKLCSTLLRSAAMPVVCVLEENGDWKQYAQEELVTFATRGGHKHIAWVAVSQRPGLMLTTVRSQVNELWCFQLDEPADLEAVEERTRDAKFASDVRALQPRQMLCWRAGGPAAAPSDAPPAPTPSATANPKDEENGKGT